MAVKLTKYNSDGSIKVAGFVPLWGFYEMAPAHVAPLWDATWTNGDGKSNFAADPNWAAHADLAEEVRRRDRLRQAAPVHLGRGRLRVRRDQPVRDRQARDEHRRRVPHGVHQPRAPGAASTPPHPCRSTTPSPTCYGAGYVTGNSLGIPRTSRPGATARRPGSSSSGSSTDAGAAGAAAPAAEERADASTPR